VLSPLDLLFSLFFNALGSALSRHLKSIGRRKKSDTVSPAVSGSTTLFTLFADDATLPTRTSADIQTLVDAVQEFEACSGIQVSENSQD
jgi:hypothetical protein